MLACQIWKVRRWSRWLLATSLSAAALITSPACEVDHALLLPAGDSPTLEHDGFTLVARIAHISDTHSLDEESPARFPGARVFTSQAWRPHEAYSTQLLDGIIRAVNRIHASGRTVDFLVHTGDACDNAQSNELAWFLAVLDGDFIDPLSGPDDRPPDDRPDSTTDPHAPFTAQGLYRNDRHGPLSSIPWYVVVGNHDTFAQGTIPIFTSLLGRRTAPLPLDHRPGILLPVVLDPIGFLAHGNVTPASPGPPRLFELPQFVTPNPQRRFFNKGEFIRAMFDTASDPPGHGFTDHWLAPSWYSVSPAPGLRLIGLDTADPAHKMPGFFYHDGAISLFQLAFLRIELQRALDRDETVVVASHHPSAYLRTIYGTTLVGSQFRALLNEFPNVVLHLAGHSHRNRVSDRGRYIEIETGSTLDPPQEGRIVEIWRNTGDGTIAVAYETFSHLDDALPPLGDDPLRAMRQYANEIAIADRTAKTRQQHFDPTGTSPHGTPSDRTGVRVFHSRAGPPPRDPHHR